MKAQHQVCSLNSNRSPDILSTICSYLWDNRLAAYRLAPLVAGCHDQACAMPERLAPSDSLAVCHVPSEPAFPLRSNITSPKTAEMHFILPTKRLAGGTNTVIEHTLVSASRAHHPLSSLLHAITFAFAFPMYL